MLVPLPPQIFRPCDKPEMGIQGVQVYPMNAKMIMYTVKRRRKGSAGGHDSPLPLCFSTDAMVAGQPKDSMYYLDTCPQPPRLSHLPTALNHLLNHNHVHKKIIYVSMYIIHEIQRTL